MGDVRAADIRVVGALLRERAGYVNRGLRARVRLVDEQLRLLGVDVLETTEDSTLLERAVPPRAARRGEVRPDAS